MGSGIVLQQLVPGQINAVVAQEGAATEYPWTEGMYTDSLTRAIGLVRLSNKMLFWG